MELTPLITAAGTFLTGIIGAIVLLVRELRRTPKAHGRVQRLVGLLRRVRDWLETEDLWDHLPPSLQRDITKVLEVADAEADAEEGGSDDERGVGGGRRVRS